MKLSWLTVRWIKKQREQIVKRFNQCVRKHQLSQRVALSEVFNGQDKEWRWAIVHVVNGPEFPLPDSFIKEIQNDILSRELLLRKKVDPEMEILFGIEVKEVETEEKTIH